MQIFFQRLQKGYKSIVLKVIWWYNYSVNERSRTAHLHRIFCCNNDVVVRYDWMYEGFTPEQRKDIEEIQRICRIFTIAENQGNKHKMLSIKNLATFRLVLSNNEIIVISINKKEFTECKIFFCL